MTTARQSTSNVIQLSLLRAATKERSCDSLGVCQTADTAPCDKQCRIAHYNQQTRAQQRQLNPNAANLDDAETPWAQIGKWLAVGFCISAGVFSLAAVACAVVYWLTLP